MFNECSWDDNLINFHVLHKALNDVHFYRLSDHCRLNLTRVWVSLV